MYHNKKGEKTMAVWMKIEETPEGGILHRASTDLGGYTRMKDGGIQNDSVTPAAETRLQGQINTLQESQTAIQESQAITDQAVQDLIITTLGGEV